MKKRAFAALAALSLCSAVLAGCAGNNQDQPAADQAGSTEGKIEVVCATFPAYDWTRQVVGDEADRFEVTYLMGAGVDLHSYQPSVEDIAKIADADLFVYVGGESDEWAVDAVETAGSADLHAISLLEAMGDAAKEEEVVEGMEADEHDHDHAEDADHAEEADHDEAEHEGEEHDHDHEEGPEYDEHVWLSLRNAQILVDVIAGELSAIDAEHVDVYAANADAYKAQLAELDGRYTDVVAAATKDTVLFADRFPFRYLVDDYGLSYYAAFVGCSAETEASFETVAFLANKVDELGLSTVLVIENSDQTIAKTVVENTKTKDQQIAVLDSLQSATDADVAAGKTYLSAMEDNLMILISALA